MVAAGMGLRRKLFLIGLWFGWGACLLPSAKAKSTTVYILPIREDIMPPLVYLVRRGVKEAMAADAGLLVIDMNTDGGRLDSAQKIIHIIQQFKGRTVTYVDTKAFSAGAFIAIATQKIYMAPQSVIGAAAPIMLDPLGGISQMPDAVRAKIVSAVEGLVRANAEKNGYNLDIVQAMVDENREVKIDGQVISQKGHLLTLTSAEAARKYGSPPKALLSSGTVDSIDQLVADLGYGNAERVDIAPLGAETLATWLNKISPLLLLIGIAGVYIEIKTPGFGVPGIIGIIAFALYFFGSYVAGLAGLEWAALFGLGLLLIGLEFFVFPGTTVLGAIGLGCVFVGLVMAAVDLYPGRPFFPSFSQLQFPLTQLVEALAGAALLVWGLSRWLPKSSIYSRLVSQGASGMQSVAATQKIHSAWVGKVGIGLSLLRPSGKAQFGDQILDVVTQGELIEKGRKVRIIGQSGSTAIVEEVD